MSNTFQADRHAWEVTNRLTLLLDRPRFEDVPAESPFAALADGAGVEFHSRRWADLIFTIDGNPWRPFRRVAYRIHRATSNTWDLVEHRYRAAETNLRVVESAQVLVVVFEDGPPGLLGLQPRDQEAHINKVLDRVLCMQCEPRNEYDGYAWHVAVDPGHPTAPERALGDGTWVTTAPDQNPDMMRDYTKRLNVGIRSGRLWAMVEKREPATDGRRIFLDQKRWFEGRAYPQPRAR